LAYLQLCSVVGGFVGISLGDCPRRRSEFASTFTRDYMMLGGIRHHVGWLLFLVASLAKAFSQAARLLMGTVGPTNDRRRAFNVRPFVELLGWKSIPSRYMIGHVWYF